MQIKNIGNDHDADATANWHVAVDGAFFFANMCSFLLWTAGGFGLLSEKMTTHKSTNKHTNM